jgi:UDP-MurNAc hydroxylase
VYITALGHAGLRVETERAVLVIDPWFDPAGAFQASWFPFPENSHVLSPSLLEPTAIVLSHEHLDHLDPWFLAHVPSSVPLVIPRYPSSAMLDKLAPVHPASIVDHRGAAMARTRDRARYECHFRTRAIADEP